MPIAPFIQDGDAIDFTPTQDTPAGTVVVIDMLIGVTKRDIKAGELGAVHVTGVFDFPKPTGADTGSGAGINVYWHEGDQNAKKAATGGGKLLGKSIVEATDDDPNFRVRLSQ
jgi:predicted RecA/RadA family phage recombinase